MANRFVRVRQYDVGFGDCMLVTFPGPRHVLVDCGSLRPASLSRIVRDIVDVTGGHIHVVVASHRHRDHVSGFSVASAIWNRTEIDEVWLPWTENDQDDVAVELRMRQDALAAELARLCRESFARRVARNCVSDDIAMDVLLHGFAGHPRRLFLSAKDGTMGSEALPGVHIQVVGPRHDAEFVRRMDVECTVAALCAETPSVKSGPFPAQWRVDRPLARRLFKQELAERPLLEREVSDQFTDICYRLDKTINNTSLFLRMRYGRANLLFPGDASGEAWDPFLEGRFLRDELARVDMYKVSHHGSHNGTPGRVIDAMARDTGEPLLSMLSSTSGELESLPSRALLKDLGRHGAVIATSKGRRRGGARRGPFWNEIDVPA